MLKKVVLDYDDVSGELMDPNGNVLVTWPGLVYHGAVSTASKTDGRLILSSVIKLKEAGFEFDEIIAMSKEGVI